ncbi:MAG: hypothetical protein ACKVPJ_03030, partial [Chitinophagales bacterium]
MKNFHRLFFLSCISFTCIYKPALAQIQLYQLSGVVADAQYKYPLGYTAVFVDGTGRATVASSEGFFSIAVAANERITFSRVGYLPKSYIVPDTLTDDIVSIGVFMYQDTVELGIIEIYPWPTREEFREAFVSLQLEEEKKLNPENFPGIQFFPADTVPPEPTVMNPISYFYENVVQPIEYSRKKRKKA